jgi:hypothetical protein
VLGPALSPGSKESSVGPLASPVSLGNRRRQLSSTCIKLRRSSARSTSARPLPRASDRRLIPDGRTLLALVSAPDPNLFATVAAGWPASDGRPNRSNDQQAEGPSPALLRWSPRAFSPTAGPAHPPTRSRRLRYRQAGLLDGTTTHTHTSGMLSCHARTLNGRSSRCPAHAPAVTRLDVATCFTRLWHNGVS